MLSGPNRELRALKPRETPRVDEDDAYVVSSNMSRFNVYLHMFGRTIYGCGICRTCTLGIPMDPIVVTPAYGEHAVGGYELWVESTRGGGLEEAGLGSELDLKYH